MPKDLSPDPLQQISWDEEHCEEALNALYNHVAGDAKSAIDWYQKARKPKKYGGLFIRGSAVVLVAAAGILPMVAELLVPDGREGPIWLEPLFASIAVGAAAALVAFDKFFGFSSAWMRFMTAELDLRTALEEFEIDWYTLRATLRGQKPTAEQSVTQIARCKEFTAKINAIVADETKAWMTEFKSSLEQVDQAVKAAEIAARTRADAAAAAAKTEADARKPGAINLEIGNIADIKTWKLWVDDKEKGEYTGATAAIAPLSPGQHTIRVFAVIDGKDRAAAKVVDVTASTTHEAKITV